MIFTKLRKNFFKVLMGVLFSVVWARILYVIWPQPSFFTFIWFYLLIGSIVLKWIIFEIIDRIDRRMKLKAVKRELEESNTRVTEVEKGEIDGVDREIAKHIPNVEYKKRLDDLKNDTLSLSRMVEKAATLSIKALIKFDVEVARKVIINDRNIDKKEFEIRQECMSILSTGNLNDDDLRMIVTVLGMITELERMGDYATGVANIAIMIGEEPSSKFLADIPLMAERGINMLKEAITAFLSQDIEKAKRVSKMDNDIDGLYDKTFRNLVFIMVDSPDNITQATRLVWASHNFERFADRVTNICEWIVYGITGENVDIEASKY